jgi:hypothetical protein
VIQRGGFAPLLFLGVAILGAACERERPPVAPLAPAPSVPAATPVAPSAVDSTIPSNKGAITGWLEVKDGRIRFPNGKPFRGRGANIHDTRSCDACAWEPPHVDEVERRIDALTDDWHATFIRLLLESYPDDGRTKNGGNARTHYKNVLEDDRYFSDVMRIIGHAGKKRGVYVLVSIWQDPTLSPLGWPTARTALAWKKIASALKDMPFVMFGLVNEPQANDDGKRDPEVWQAMNDTVLAIRSVERPGRHHIITVQGTREWGRSLDYYVEHPITAGGGANIAYETHVYNRPTRFDELVVRPAKRLPVIIGELGPQQDHDVTMLPEDCSQLFDLAETLDVPWIAWSFHNNCPPNLLVERKNACGAGASLEPSPWGRMVKARLARPW